LAIKLLFRAYLNRSNWNADDDDLANSNDNGLMAKPWLGMNLYSKLCSWENLSLAFKKAKKGKTKKDYVIEFQANAIENIEELQKELINENYAPKSLVNFILRDPKTRKISKSHFRDRIVHHALIQVIEPIFEKSFIYDSCANQIGKGNLFAIKKFDLYKRKVTNNLYSAAFCLKCDVRHYFEEVNHEILINILLRKIKDKKIICLINKILKNGFSEKGMPLGNLTSQFFANVYLNELDYFVKHKLKAKFYIRYVDDFIILDNSKIKLELLKNQINIFLYDKLKIELHPQKSKIISLSRGLDFVGFRNYWHHKLLRKRNIKKMFAKVKDYKYNEIPKKKLLESFQGWNAYAKWADSYKLRKKIAKNIY